MKLDNREAEQKGDVLDDHRRSVGYVVPWRVNAIPKPSRLRRELEMRKTARV